MGSTIDFSKNKHERNKLKKLVDAVRDADVTQKAKGAIVTTFQISTFLEQYAAEMASEAELADEDSRTPFLIAMGGDFSVPGIPVGSFAVGLVAYMIDPGSMKRALRNMQEKIVDDETVEKFADLGDRMTAEIDEEAVDEAVEKATSSQKWDKARDAVQRVADE